MLSLGHPCIIRLLDVVEENGMLVLAYKLFGETLLELYSATKHGLNEN